MVLSTTHVVIRPCQVSEVVSPAALMELQHASELSKALKGARLHVVMGTRECRAPLVVQGEPVLPVHENSRLPALLDLLDSHEPTSHALMKGHEPGP